MDHQISRFEIAITQVNYILKYIGFVIIFHNIFTVFTFTVTQW